MKSSFFSLLLGLVAIWLAATIFSETIILGPLFILVAVVSVGYSLYRFTRIKPKFGKVVLAFLFNLLSFPFE